eukprot:TRINITY_DN2560_c0_g2_i2.p1 TRINITY_DN2560_c0_g2~~TRINITY_DN2560_c0_g2_i2.p1  ORF type:complete len:341 (-),score=97.04 TRINITY_DN2560_c0_g2_i2:842-1864(-)
MSESRNLCHNCGEVEICKEAGEEPLCRECLKKCPRTQCDYCRLYYHCLERYVDKIPHACHHCRRQKKKYKIEPNNCCICGNPCAWNGRKCRYCIHNEKKFGSPVECDECKKLRAFDRGIEQRKKYNDAMLCLWCVLEYKQQERQSEKEKLRKEKQLEKGLASNCKSCINLQEQQNILEEKIDRLEEEHNISLVQQEIKYQNLINEKDKEITALNAENIKLKSKSAFDNEENMLASIRMEKINKLEKENINLKQNIEIFRSDKVKLESDKITLTNDAERTRNRLIHSKNMITKLKRAPFENYNSNNTLSSSGLININTIEDIDDDNDVEDSDIQMDGVLVL